MPKSKLDWCFAKEDRLKFIKPDIEKAKSHVNKAKHNLRAADYNFNGGFHDWAVSQSYYAMYHGLIAILSKYGLESKNHSCTFVAVEDIILKHNIDLSKVDLAFIRTTEQMETKDVKSLREEFQYGTKTELNREILINIIQKAKEIVEKIELIIIQ